jgi:sulfite reductase alpha subunit-like flavoprotein
MDAPGDERRALILYASETGNAHDIAKELDRLCERLRFNTTLCDFNSVKIVRIVCLHVFSVAQLHNCPTF